MKKTNAPEQTLIAKQLLKWSLLAIPVAATAGSLVALFLWLLDWAGTTRYQNSWLLYLLPPAGVGIYFLYKLWGKNSEAGNNLIMDEIHQPGGGVPLRMAPLVLLTTVITHLFGGSAGREGTAVQIGGSLAGMFGRWFKLKPQDISLLLMMGIAAGFGAVFGTPLTGAIFALEVLYIGRITHRALLPCLIAALLGDMVCSAWGAQHTHYHITVLAGGNRFFPQVHLNGRLLLTAAGAGICFGLASWLFSSLSHGIKQLGNRMFSRKWLIPAVGGGVVIALTVLLGTRDYLGLGVVNPDPEGVSIVSAFREGGTGYFSWFWKLLFTSITLGTGFKGGEVTPLFFIGATLGGALSVVTGAPVDLMAGLGFVAVFAGATNTPIACTIMGIELFGGEFAVYFAVACFTAYYFSGHTGIYQSQRIAVSKNGIVFGDTTLKELRSGEG